MREQEVAVGGLSVRRQFERSRLEADLFEAAYDALLAESASAEARARARMLCTEGAVSAAATMVEV